MAIGGVFSVLTERIHRYLDNYDYTSAIFLCEKLSSLCDGKDENIKFLLATCYHRRGKPHRVRNILKSCKDPACRYLFAVACFECQKYREAETALLDGCDVNSGEISKIANCNTVPNGAAGLNLLGQIAQRSGRRDAAIAYYEKSLELDSFLWSSFQALCQLGYAFNHDDLFKLEHGELEKYYNSQFQVNEENISSPRLNQSFLLTPIDAQGQDPFITPTNNVIPVKPKPKSLEYGTSVTFGKPDRRSRKMRPNRIQFSSSSTKRPGNRPRSNIPHSPGTLRYDKKNETGHSLTTPIRCSARLAKKKR